MDINFIVYNQENQPVGMNVDELFEGADPNAEKVALAVVKQLIRMRIISSVICKNENGDTLVNIN